MSHLYELFCHSKLSKKELLELDLASNISSKDQKPKTIKQLIQKYNFKTPHIIQLLDYLYDSTANEDYNISKINLSYLQDAIIDMNYSQYEDSQRQQAERIIQESQNLSLKNFDFSSLKGVISNEEYEILSVKKPRTLKAMSRTSGIRPNTLHIVRGKFLNQNNSAQ